MALKIESPDITHKSDAGGVALSLSDGAMVREAYARMENDVRRRAPNAEIAGFTVQPMIDQGVEMILGVKRDPLFGPVVSAAWAVFWSRC